MQTREVFAAEAATIADGRKRIVWLAPSRDEGGTGTALHAEVPKILVPGFEGAPVQDDATPTIQGGRERGVILHKLIEEVLTGEIAETETALIARAETLIHEIGQLTADDPAQGLVPAEIAACVVRALALPEIIALRPQLLAEFPVYASIMTGEQEEATAGTVDAIAFDADGIPQVVVDWKSDVAPPPETLEHYCAQVRAYLDVTKAGRGLIVLATSGVVIPIARTRPTVPTS